MNQLLPDIDRGETWTEQHKTQCLVRQLLRWKAQGNRSALEVMQRSAIYQGLKSLAVEQWNLGNRGAKGDWR